MKQEEIVVVRQRAAEEARFGLQDRRRVRDEPREIVLSNLGPHGVAVALTEHLERFFHVLADDIGKTRINPGYSLIGRLKGLAELRGIMRAVERFGLA